MPAAPPAPHAPDVHSAPLPPTHGNDQRPARVVLRESCHRSRNRPQRPVAPRPVDRVVTDEITNPSTNLNVDPDTGPHTDKDKDGT
jgi:hypothetical protein